MSTKFNSQYFETADDLVKAKDDAWEQVETRRQRLGVIRKFTNMQRTMTDEEVHSRAREIHDNFCESDGDKALIFHCVLRSG